MIRCLWTRSMTRKPAKLYEFFGHIQRLKHAICDWNLKRQYLCEEASYRKTKARFEHGVFCGVFDDFVSSISSSYLWKVPGDADVATKAVGITDPGYILGYPSARGCTACHGVGCCARTCFVDGRELTGAWPQSTRVLGLPVSEYQITDRTHWQIWKSMAVRVYALCGWL